MATAGFFAAKWTRKIEQEWMQALEENKPHLKGRLDIRRNCMRDAVPDWEVAEAAWAPLIDNYRLPDLDDRHVLAAAIVGHADCIVTMNLRDFPLEVVGTYGIDVVDPDRFIINQWDLDAVAAISAFKRMRARWKKPEDATAEDFVQAIERNGLLATAQRLREAVDLI